MSWSTSFSPKACRESCTKREVVEALQENVDDEAKLRREKKDVKILDITVITSLIPNRRSELLFNVVLFDIISCVYLLLHQQLLPNLSASKYKVVFRI